MTERLVGIRPAMGVGGRGRGVRSVLVVRAVGSRGAMRTKGFVGVRGLLGGDTSGRVLGVVVRRTTGAAARADDPEESSSEGEGSGQPGGCEDVLAHGSGNIVGFEFLVEERREDSEEGSGSGRCGCGEEERNLYDSLASCSLVGWIEKGRTYTCNQASHTATPTTADSKETNNQFNDGGDECDDVGNEHPLGNALVRVEGLAQPIGKRVFHARVLHTPDLEGVEVEGGLGLGAEVRLVLVVGGDVARAVAPDTHGVEVLEVQFLRSIVHDLVEVRAGDIHVGSTKSRLDFRFGS